MTRSMSILLLASALAASPAVARDNSLYVGVEGGVMKAKRLNFDAANTTIAYDNYLSVRHKYGYDVDGLLGYDFGFFRLEGELGIKRAKLRGFDIRNTAQPGDRKSVV